MKRHSPLLLILVLLGALAASQAAGAASPSRPTPTFAHPTLRDAAEPEEEEFEVEADEVEECEASAEGFEFGGDDEEVEEEESGASCDAEGEAGKSTSKGAPFITAPVACQVRRAESTIATLPGSDQVRLTVRYQTYAPTEVTVGLKLKDHKGSVAIERTTRHLGPKGVLHITTKLGAAAMERALTASEFDISLRAPESPGFCAGDLEQRLRATGGKHKAGASRVYGDPRGN